MNFINNLFGGSDNGIFTGILALTIVIILIIFGVWLLKLLLELSGNVGRGKAKRLDIVETLALDQKRHLVIIRRDNVEHLIMTGGANEIVVESNIAIKPKANMNQKPKNSKEMQNIKKKINTALGKEATVEPVMGSVSLRHTGLLRRKNDDEDIINPQTFNEDKLFNEAENADSAIDYLDESTKLDKSSNVRDKEKKK